MSITRELNQKMLAPSPGCLHPLSRSPEESCNHSPMICVMVTRPPQGHIPEHPMCTFFGQEIILVGLNTSPQPLQPSCPSPPHSAPTTLDELSAHVRQAPEITLLGDFLISFIPRYSKSMFMPPLNNGVHPFGHSFHAFLI